MTLGQIAELVAAQREMQQAARAAAKRAETHGEERPATMADAMMLARLGLTPPAG